MQIFEQCELEILELHRFFERWFNGDLEDTAAAFTRISDVLAERFLLVSPGGERRERRLLLAELRESYGSRGGGAHPFRIRIEKIEGRMRVGGLALITYEEWQEMGGSLRGRVSSALFQERADTPNGVEWVHLHETWLPAERQPQLPD